MKFLVVVTPPSIYQKPTKMIPKISIDNNPMNLSAPLGDSYFKDCRQTPNLDSLNSVNQLIISNETTKPAPLS